MFWLYLLQHLIANLVYVLYYTLRGRGRVLLKAKYDALQGMSAARKKRDTIQNRRRVSNAALKKLMQHGLLQPYLLGYQLRKSLQKS